MTMEHPYADSELQALVREAWQQHRQLRDASLLKGKCGIGPFKQICGGCRARAYALTGDYLESDPTCIYQPPDKSIEEKVQKVIPAASPRVRQEPLRQPSE